MSEADILPTAKYICVFSVGFVLGYIGNERMAMLLVGALFVGGIAFAYGKVVQKRELTN